MKGILDVVLTLPLVLPPTVVGYFLLMILGPRRLLGAWFLQIFDTKLVMTWYAGIFAASIVAFPLMYRTARGAFENFDQTLAYAVRLLDCRILIFSGTFACRPADRESWQVRSWHLHGHWESMEQPVW